MKFNIDCARDVLLLLEKKPFYSTNENGFITSEIVLFYDICAELPQYSRSDLYYTLSILGEADFIDLASQWGDNALIFCAVKSMTYKGHKFLEDIRDDNRWKAVTSGLTAVRNYSLSTVAAIAEGMTAGAINAYLGRRQ